jgi:hypothetical protein
MLRCSLNVLAVACVRSVVSAEAAPVIGAMLPLASGR